MPYQNLSVSLSQKEREEIISKITKLKTDLTFLVNLTTLERKRLRKVADKRQSYITDVLAAVKANPTAIPASIDIEEYIKDAELYLHLSEILTHLRPLMEGVEDTLMASGNEAITVTDQCYGFLKQSARGNSILTDTVKELSKHFKGQGKKRNYSEE